MTFKTFISLVPACLSAISCIHLHDGGEKREIVFEVTVASNTRAAGNDGLRLPENEDIAVQGYSLPSNAPWASAKDEARMEMDNVRAVHSEGDIWVPEEKHEWPENGRNMSFFAYSPYGRGEFSRDGTITVSGYSVSEGAGLMFCSATDCGYSTLGHVSLKFTRALCSVEFHIQSSLKTGNTARISGLDISGLSACGDFHSRPVPSWVPDGVPQDFIFFEGETFTGDSAEALGDTRYLIPQSGEMQVRLTFDILNGDLVYEGFVLTAEKPVSWKVGKHYSYILKISEDLKLTVQNASANV